MCTCSQDFRRRRAWCKGCHCEHQGLVLLHHNQLINLDDVWVRVQPVVVHAVHWLIDPPDASKHLVFGSLLIHWLHQDQPEGLDEVQASPAFANGCNQYTQTRCAFKHGYNVLRSIWIAVLYQGILPRVKGLVALCTGVPAMDNLRILVVMLLHPLGHASSISTLQLLSCRLIVMPSLVRIGRPVVTGDPFLSQT